jgi:hypothetical protein
MFTSGVTPQQRPLFRVAPCAVGTGSAALIPVTPNHSHSKGTAIVGTASEPPLSKTGLIRVYVEFGCRVLEGLLLIIYAVGTEIGATGSAFDNDESTTPVKGGGYQTSST